MLKDHDSDVSYIMFNSNWNYGGYESMVYHHSNNGIFILGENKIGNIEDHIQDLTYWYEYDPSIIVIFIMRLITAEMLSS